MTTWQRLTEQSEKSDTLTALDFAVIEIESLTASNKTLTDENARLVKERDELAEQRNHIQRRFPIMKGPDVPWEVMAPHETWAQNNHYQSLEKLASRGGLSPGEAWCVVQGIKCPNDHATWDRYNEKWIEFAECVNLHYEKLENLQSQLTAAHLEIGRLREAAKTARAVLMKSAVTVLDSCTCDGCNTIRLIDQALTPTTPNPILQDLNELQQESDALAKWGDAHGQKGEHSVWETLDNMVERLKELERDRERLKYT